MSRADSTNHWSENGFARKKRHRSEILTRIFPKERTICYSLFRVKTVVAGKFEHFYFKHHLSAKSYGVTIQMKPVWQFCCKVPLFFTNKIWDLSDLEFWFFAPLGVKGCITFTVATKSTRLRDEHILHPWYSSIWKSLDNWQRVILHTLSLVSVLMSLFS